MLFSSKSESHVALVLDIQTFIVRGALVCFAPGALPEFLYIHSIPISFKPNVSSGYLVKVTLKAISDAVQHILQEISFRNSTSQNKELLTITRVHTILSSPWIVSRARIIALTFQKDTKITKEFIHSHVAIERDALLKNDTENLSVIEEKIFDIYLNGYSVPQWEGRTTRELEISYVVSVAGTRIIKSIRDILQHSVSVKDVRFHSSLLLQQIGIQKVMPEQSEYALIHVHGELTDIIVVKKHAGVFFGSYPIGTQGLIRKIAHASKSDIHTAESLLSLSMGDHLDISHAGTTRKILDNVASGWVHGLDKLLIHSNISASLPEQVVISAHAHDEYIIRALTTFYPHIHITPLTLEHITPYVTFARNSERLRILGLCVEAINSIGE
jgi:cell division ATPase FtsA